MGHFQIKKGLNIPIAGAASGAVQPLPAPKSVAYAPEEFRGITPKPAVKVGDKVKVGSVVFCDKANPGIQFLSPAAGTVAEVRRGARRVIKDIVINVEGDDSVELTKVTAEKIPELSRAEAKQLILDGGLWACITTRPLDRIPSPDTLPQSVLVSAFQTGPLQPGAAEMLDADDAQSLSAGIDLLKAATGAEINVVAEAGSAHPALSELQGVNLHQFSGPHPAGDMGVQVNYIDPPRGDSSVWCVRAWDVVLMGRVALEGKFPADRIYAAVGAGVKSPRLVKTLLGAPISDILGETTGTSIRTIRGSVLTGKGVDNSRWAGFTTNAIHALPNTVETRLFGWTMPNIDEFSTSRTFLSGFFHSKKNYDIRPGVWGGVRALLPMGMYEKVIATPDIMPYFLFRAMAVGDIEDSIRLGMLDLTMEEAALCTYTCPSKLEIDSLLRGMLEKLEEEA